MRFPGRIAPGVRVPELVRLIDLAATIIDLLGLDGGSVAEKLAAMDGESFAPLLRDAGDARSQVADESPAEPLRRRRIFLESENCPGEDPTVVAPGMLCDPPGVAGKVRAVFDGHWKLIVTLRTGGRRYELYDLSEDPRDTVDRSADERERVAALEADLDRFWSRDSPAVEVDEELIENLRALGYLP
jgi:arylsulfatase A-like enzyme